ncbi:MAG: hypothetical protein ACYDDI_12485, partial [Candidatus Acidiferrales bacterium]
HLLDLFAVGVVTDGAFALVTGRGCFGFRCGNATFLGGSGCHRILLKDLVGGKRQACDPGAWLPDGKMMNRRGRKSKWLCM